MKPFINGFWHAWESNGKILLSNENTKQLRSFESVDACINWLYMNDAIPAARALHTAKNESDAAPDTYVLSPYQKLVSDAAQAIEMFDENELEQFAEEYHAKRTIKKLGEK